MVTGADVRARHWLKEAIGFIEILVGYGSEHHKV
jgi:hypothetical protein